MYWLGPARQSIRCKYWIEKAPDFEANRTTQTEQVAQVQFVVSNTRCPALHDCELELGEGGEWPQRGQSPV